MNGFSVDISRWKKKAALLGSVYMILCTCRQPGGFRGTYQTVLPVWFVISVALRVVRSWGWVSLKLPLGFDLWCFSFQEKRSPGFSRVQLSEDAFLQYVHFSETLTLTFNHTAEHLLETDIKLFRKYFWDRAFLIKVCVPSFWYIITHPSWSADSKLIIWGTVFWG